MKSKICSYRNVKNTTTFFDLGLTTALIVTLALSTMSCRSSKTFTQQTHSETIHYTLREIVTLTLYDTIKETTTILIQTNTHGATTRLATTRLATTTLLGLILIPLIKLCHRIKD